MAIFKVKSSKGEETQELENKKTKIENNENSENIKIVNRPRICCLDLEEQTIKKLRESGANIFDGTLGSKVKVPNNQRNTEHQLLLNFNFPSNLHEFDIFILDLDCSKTIEWKEIDHKREDHTGNKSFFFISQYPETLFNPRPFSSHILRLDLNKIKRPYLVIAFSTSSYDVEYETIWINSSSYHPEREGFSHNIYSFWYDVPLSDTLFGKEIQIAEITNPLLFSILEKYKNDSIYNQTFNHPSKWNKETRTYDKETNFIPLMTNLHDDIISFAQSYDNGKLFLFPQIKDKANFLLDFLSNFAPSIFPEIFPFSSTFKWIEEENYWLPNHFRLLEDKEKIQQEYQNKIEAINSQISENQSKYSFLHKLLTETDESLVYAVIEFLKWLEFENVVAFDETKNSKINEEDIQVDLADEGLLVIECKGIGGTSTDADCSQISKIKHRRCRERNKFDVYALYIVNHERFLPPLKRKNPPFTTHQIQDAENDERGLLTTWQLFNLFFDIEKGLLTKEEARKLILEYGLVDFRPTNLAYVDTPKEIFKEGTVCIVNIGDEVILNKNEVLFVEKNGKFELNKIIEIQKDVQDQLSATNGEFGLKLGSPIKRDSILWKKVKKSLTLSLKS